MINDGKKVDGTRGISLMLRVAMFHDAFHGDTLTDDASVDIVIS
jgi:hypothetical protein